jgi:hypothetical protein
MVSGFESIKKHKSSWQILAYKRFQGNLLINLFPSHLQRIQPDVDNLSKKASSKNLVSFLIQVFKEGEKKKLPQDSLICDLLVDHVSNLHLRLHLLFDE